MTLSERQSWFSYLVIYLLEEAHRTHPRVTLGEAWRPAETAELYARQGRGSANSLHRDRLAIDLNLFGEGDDGRVVYLRSTEAHRPLGEFWERLPDKLRADGVDVPTEIVTAWGGRFDRPDGNHYSLSYRGRR